MDLLVLLLSLVFLIPAVNSDLHSGRIPNYLCCSGFVAGVFLHLAFSGIPGAALSLAGGALLLFSLFPFFAVNRLGAGDVKLIAAVGAIGGSPVMAITILVAIVISGAVLALGLRFWHTVLKDLRIRIASSGPISNLTHSFFTKVPIIIRPKTDSSVTNASEFPYAVAIMTGTIAALTLSAFGL